MVIIIQSALFTEVPHDITTQSGEDVEMACSFRGAGSPSYSLEIQWWYIKDHRDWQEQSAQITNNVVPQEETSKDATKISVVKVAGSNISHKLRLSSVKPSDEGTYECRVIDFSGTAPWRSTIVSAPTSWCSPRGVRGRTTSSCRSRGTGRRGANRTPATKRRAGN
ncbi:hypothetical protein L3Q82_007698 [Scortum barcoo]|uniref:Uncharacterized protein n=1 Tax=Scortum barcoo TaxID=214431 RepID=A0ACB8WP04_9TELE|nr:hypothetical protein L3Q82_007698 [Scortum barcoo]